MFHCWTQTCLIYHKLSASQQALTCRQNPKGPECLSSCKEPLRFYGLKTPSRWHQILMPAHRSAGCSLRPCKVPYQLGSKAAHLNETTFKRMTITEVSCLYGLPWHPLCWHRSQSHLAGQTLLSSRLKAFTFCGEAWLLQWGHSTSIISQCDISKDSVYVLFMATS